MPDFGPAELAIILVVVVLIFGSQKLGDLGGSLGKGIRDFRRELKSEDDVQPATASAQPPIATASAPDAVAPTATGQICAHCDTENAPTAVFCNECGKSLKAEPSS